MGSFGPLEISMPRARLRVADGTEREWRSAVLPRYARRTGQMEALIASAYLSGTNTRRVQRALAALFRGTVGKDVVSRAWRKVKADWDAWCRRDLAGEDIVWLVLDGTVVKVRLDRKATSLSLLVVLPATNPRPAKCARVSSPSGLCPLRPLPHVAEDERTFEYC